ncbi:MAG: VanZ family protein [Candidatus Zixiibacteriota bacterium]
MVLKNKFVLYHLPLVLYAGVVITLSSIPQINPPQIRFLAADKVAHFIEYGIFSVLAFRSFSRLGNRVTPNKAVVISALFLCLFAAFDEYYQKFIPGRMSDMQDLLTDLAGAFLVLFLLWLRARKRQISR